MLFDRRKYVPWADGKSGTWWYVAPLSVEIDFTIFNYYNTKNSKKKVFKNLILFFFQNIFITRFLDLLLNFQVFALVLIRNEIFLKLQVSYLHVMFYWSVCMYICIWKYWNYLIHKMLIGAFKQLEILIHMLYIYIYVNIYGTVREILSTCIHM